MPRFPVMIDGREYEVKAKDSQEALAKAEKIDPSTTPFMVARSGTDRVFERPQTGQRYLVGEGYSTTNPEKVEKALSKMSIGQEGVTEQFAREMVSSGMIEEQPLAAASTQILRGLPFVGSYADEAIGAIGGEQAGQRAERLSQAMQEEMPLTSLGLNIGGAALTGAGLLGAAPAAVSAIGRGLMSGGIGRRALKGAAMGATEAGIYETGESDPDIASATGFGSVLGGAAGAAGPALEAAGRVIGRNISKTDIATIASTFGISPNAARVIKNTFDIGGGMEDAVRNLERAGESGMVADAGPSAQALLDAAGAASPEASAMARRPIEERMAQQQGLLSETLTEELGQPAAGPKTAVREIQQSTAPERSAAYRQAYETPIDYSSAEGMEIEKIIFDRVNPRDLRSAIEEANEQIRDEAARSGDEALKQIKANIADDGTISFEEMPNMQQLDQLKRTLTDLGDAAMDTSGMVPKDTAKSRRLKRQANDLRDAMVKATTDPETGMSPYARALDIGGDTIRERNAFELGMEATKRGTRLEDITEELGATPSADQIKAFERGIRTRIDEVIGEVKRIPSDSNIDARQALATLRELGSDNVRNKIRTAIGEQKANRIFTALDEAMVAAETRSAIAINSKTAIRQAADEGVKNLISSGPVQSALQGEPVNTTKELIRAVTGFTEDYTQEQRTNIYRDIVKALTEKRGAEARQALNSVNMAMQGVMPTEEDLARIAKLISAGAVTSATPSAGRTTRQELENR